MINAQKIPKCTATQIVAFSRDWGQVFRVFKVWEPCRKHFLQHILWHLWLEPEVRNTCFLDVTITTISSDRVVVCWCCFMVVRILSILRRCQVGPSAITSAHPNIVLSCGLSLPTGQLVSLVSHTYKEITTELHRSQSLSFRLYSRQHAIHRSWVLVHPQIGPLTSIKE